jgi:HAD superfamily hydrolase (TIGR01459 family)
MQRAQPIMGLRAIAAQYDLYLLDQFGVLHDGNRPYDGVLEAIDALHAAGKSIVVLTNSGKRAAPNLKRLVDMGFPREAISAVVSSGEIAWTAVRNGLLHAGAHVYFVGRDGERYGLDDLGLVQVDAPDEAELIFILGSNAPTTSLEEYRALLAPAAARRVPVLCANPDVQMIVKGKLEAAPGAIARVYQSLGGSVEFIGKPHAKIYGAAIQLFPQVSKSMVIAVGDSMEHDVRGATGVGLASVLVRSGVSVSIPDDVLQALYEREGAWPDYVLDRFCW